jgi:hypothetical protein
MSIKDYLVTVRTIDDANPTATLVMLGDALLWDIKNIDKIENFYPDSVPESNSTINPMPRASPFDVIPPPPPPILKVGTKPFVFGPPRPPVGTPGRNRTGGSMRGKRGLIKPRTLKKKINLSKR